MAFFTALKDLITKGLVVILTDHHEIHEEHHFFIKTWFDIDGAGTVKYFLFRTPDSTVKIHAKARFSAEAEFTIEISEDPVTTADGTPVANRNNFRDSLVTALSAAFVDPTVTAQGDIFWSGKVGSGKDSTVGPLFNYEIVAKRNTDYLFKITKEAAGTHWLDADFWWYEEDHG